MTQVCYCILSLPLFTISKFGSLTNRTEYLSTFGGYIYREEVLGFLDFVFGIH